MSTKTKKRLQAATNWDDLHEILALVQDYGLGSIDAYIEFRPRTSGKEGDWKEVPAHHLWNLEAYNYRQGDKPRIWLSDGRVETKEGCISVDDAKIVIKLARRAHKSGETYYIPGADDSADDGRYLVEPMDYSIDINGKDGWIKVGCEQFTWKEISEFAKKQGW